MPKEVPQALVVTMAATAAQTIEITPAVDTTTAQTLGTVRAGDDQTITIQPAS